MAEKNVVGIYKTENEAVSAINRLFELGYEDSDISVLAKDPERYHKMESLTDVNAETPKAVARAAGAGAATGGVLGGIGGLLLGLGALAIPGVGPFLAAGPIAAALGGMAAGGAVGGVVGALAGLGFDKEEARSYEEAINRGDLLVLVKADADRYERVSDVFRYPEEEYYQRYERTNLDSHPYARGVDPDAHPQDARDIPFVKNNY